MYGALRNRASNSSQLAGLSIAALITALAAYALGHGFGASIIRLIETPITFTPLPDEVIPEDPTLREPTLVMGGETLDPPPVPLAPAPSAKAALPARRSGRVRICNSPIT